MVEISEAQLKQGIEEWLQYKQNAGKLWFTRLNSGSAFVKKGDRFHKIQLCEKGTADLLVLKRREFVHRRLRTIFLEIKSATGKQHPEQKAFQELIEAQGAEYWVVRSVEEVISIIG